MAGARCRRLIDYLPSLGVLPHGALGQATLAFPAGTHNVVAKYLGSSTVTAAAADREVRALR